MGRTRDLRRGGDCDPGRDLERVQGGQGVRTAEEGWRQGGGEGPPERHLPSDRLDGGGGGRCRVPRGGRPGACGRMHRRIPRGEVRRGDDDGGVRAGLARRRAACDGRDLSPVGQRHDCHRQGRRPDGTGAAGEFPGTSVGLSERRSPQALPRTRKVRGLREAAPSGSAEGARSAGRRSRRAANRRRRFSGGWATWRTRSASGGRLAAS